MIVGLPPCPLFGGGGYLRRAFLALVMPVTLVGSAIPLVRDRVIYLGGRSVVRCGEASLLVRRNGIRA